MATNNRDPVRQARIAFADARDDLVDALYRVEVAQAELDDAKRSLSGDDLTRFTDALTTATGSLVDARTAETGAFNDLQLALSTWLPDGTPAEDDVSRLDANSPIVLFPVRLETRFAGNVLKVRVYPDEIFHNSHETALTREEYDAGKAYYVELNEKNNERALWRDMVARFGVERSAYILREMLPVFGDPGPASSYWASSSTCGGTIFGGNNEDLFFPPDVQFRARSWTRPVESVLPERWVFVTYRGRERKIYLGSRILEPLAMTPDPSSAGPESLSRLITTTRGDYSIDDKVRWTVDFGRAVQVGMGIEIGDAAAGFDRLIVVGVKSSLTALETSRLVEKLFDAHHYTRGVALVRQGSPTNNTEGRPTSYPREENAGSLSFGIERQRAPLDREFSHHCLPKETDGYALSLMLGVPSGVFANVERAYETEIQRSRLMKRVLWPGTLGYYMQQLMDPIFGAPAIANARTFFEEYVMPRGPAPAFRIGSTPYGVLPIAALREWAPRTFGSVEGQDVPMQAVEAALLDPLRRLLDVWLTGSSNVPRIRSTNGSADVDLAKVLSTQPSSREFRIRVGKGFIATTHLYLLEGWDLFLLEQRLRRQSQDTFGRIGHREWFPPLGKIDWNESSWFLPFNVVAQQLSETDALPGFNLLSGIHDATARQLNAMNHAGAAPGNLLYLTLRQSTLAEYARIAGEQLLTRWVEYEIFGLSGTVAVPVIPSVYQLEDATLLKGLAHVHLDALRDLAPLPSAELDRLFTETLDVTSHRIDAWITALAYRRLADMRRAQESTELAPKGDFIGGYGWLENLRPRAPDSTVPLGDGRVAERQLKNGGFVHAPSMSHATAAAVLRNGNLSLKGEAASAFAVDLSSRRVRMARQLFDGIRNGQPLGALLGYQFERAMHDLNESAPGLDTVRFALRSRFPLVANKAGQDGTAPAESIAARNVVDGQLLLTALKNDQIPWGTAPLPARNSSLYNLTVDQIRKLELAYDAAADLLTAEGVFQIVRGNVEAAVPALNNLVEGLQFPDSIVARSARGGTGIAHRVLLVFPEDLALPVSANWPAPTARAIAEPTLDAWLGQLIGDPDAVTARITYRNEDGSELQPAVTVKLSELGLRPLDLFAIAGAVATSNQASLLDDRLLDVALNDPARRPLSEPFRIEIAYRGAADSAFARVLEVLHAAGPVLRASRPLAAKDLLPPAESDVDDPGVEPAGAPTLAFYQRGLDAKQALSTARAALDAAQTDASLARSALRQAAPFAPLSAFPNPRATDEALADAVRGTLAEFDRRLAAVPAALPATSTNAQLTAQARATLAAVFGDGFVALPFVSPPKPDELGLSLAARDTLLAGDERAPERYLQQAMRARPRLGVYRKFGLYARALGLARPRLDVVQFPHVPDETWLGLPFDEPPEKGRAALLVLSYADELDPLSNWCGLVLDDWSEIIPNRSEETGFAFHYRGPHAEAPQAVLVATPSRNAPQWSFEELIASLEQAMQLYKVRAVTNEDHDMGQAFPAIVFGTNPNLETTVSSAIAGAIRTVTEALNG